ncbi:hypothetical protein [Lederbergia galactosidilytica]|uniref:Uncharacterized protein n=1 Tax=Lederbergia galactosidilytica TaxID=217031 RepID=A0A177ZMN8_9BACI|nr:hypothetical protein [Lederbergia galactosidilytica]KRG16048.1 hypothetical protein ACA30_02990 [Virgibacillus soli]MBP1915313.1 hypothetical protein [Lederbergia galactosidilytica]OAK68138.1 hypothetical protein ABB05_16370 [Lederbergia galactosidilytica]
MKKILLYSLSLWILAILFAGCSAKGNQGLMNDDWNQNLGKTQKIEVQSGDKAKTITDHKEIEDFIGKLEIDNWELAEIPSDAEEEYQYTLFQEDTRQFGKAKSDQLELKEIANIITYRDLPYLKLRMENFTLSFAVPEHVAEFINQS